METGTSETWGEKHQTNLQIRRDNNIPTIESEIYSGDLCNIYRWYTTKAITYLNSKNEFNADMGYLDILCVRMGGILQGRERNEAQKQQDRETRGDYISFIKTEARTRTTNCIKTRHAAKL